MKQFGFDLVHQGVRCSPRKSWPEREGMSPIGSKLFRVLVPECSGTHEFYSETLLHRGQALELHFPGGAGKSLGLIVFASVAVEGVAFPFRGCLMACVWGGVLH